MTSKLAVTSSPHSRPVQINGGIYRIRWRRSSDIIGVTTLLFETDELDHVCRTLKGTRRVHQSESSVRRDLTTLSAALLTMTVSHRISKFVMQHILGNMIDSLL